MKFIYDAFARDAQYESLLSAVKNNSLPLAASGLSRIHKSAVAAALNTHTGRKIMMITHDEASADALKDDLVSLGKRAVNFPSRDYNIAGAIVYSREYEHKRINTLSRIIDGDFDLITVSLDAVLQYTVPPEIIKQNRFILSVGDTVDTKKLSQNLIGAGYVRSELTEGVGQFSVRGGIIDLFPPDSSAPVRIELWGDEIDNISVYDVVSQRRTESLESIKISPACELPYNSDGLCEKLSSYLQSRTKLSDKQKESIERDITALKEGRYVSPDLYMPFLYGKIGTLFDYTDGLTTIVCESGNFAERFKSISVLQGEEINNYLESGLLSSATSKLSLDKEEFNLHLDNALFFESFPRSVYSVALKSIVNFDYKNCTAWSGDISVLKEDISYNSQIGGCTVILAGENRAAGVLCETLCEQGIDAIYAKTPDAVSEKGVFVCCGGLSSGFELPSVKFQLITHRYISADVKKRVKKPKNAKEIGSLDELKRGDYVVHSAHGIGIFDGINRITNDKVTKDYIKIKYYGNDILYVPVTQLDMVSKYIGAATEDRTLRLNRLGGADWQKTRNRVRAAVKDMAKQLTALYAKRMASKGYAFSPDTDLQNNFERRFEYDETLDQLRCIDEIKRDMERAVPMDRLLCGDVGFGKTEVALRAAFKCVSEGKQCAMLVPTTILSMQHYTTVLSRFGEMPVRVELLNRFVTPKKQEKIIKDIALGKVDMVIGTHRLISKDVKFKDIGLVIIDEEQRFGVAQKERLKELYPFVDILTLSATPIPRTLNMAMSGLRDMSSIDEAPGDRFPVQSYVLEYNLGIVCDAINKELRRGGQVYYLHNRVETIESCAGKIKQRIPDAKIGIAHGKMSEEELSGVWQQLIEKEIDILVCTTIIETGVDVPNVNTLIIENADRMGLSQLHQLRGRVGRSPRRAYAYFCFSPAKQLSEIATKRLEAIRQFTEFGSGFKIALRDLEIRGAGSILGGEQHGNMEAVGYDMYLKLLADAVCEENGVIPEKALECTVDLNISAHIPEDYIESLSARLGIYKRIADIENENDAMDVTDELCDRFGEPPQTVMGLIDIALLRNRAARAGISEITENEKTVLLHTERINPLSAAKLSEYFGDRFTVNAIGEPAYVIKKTKTYSASKLSHELSKALSEENENDRKI